MDYEPRDNQVYPAVNFLPEEIRFGEGFRADVVAFVRSGPDDVVFTNLPVGQIPADLAALCENVAEKALLAYVIASGESTQYAHLDYCVAQMRRLAREFAAKFLQPLELPNTTQVIPVADIATWYKLHGLYGWGRAIRNPPGTEYG